MDHRIHRIHRRYTEYIMESSNIICKIVKKMTTKDFKEFYYREKPLTTLMGNLRLFLEEKYCEAENTINRDYYGNLCNLTHYPGWYVYLILYLYLL